MHLNGVCIEFPSQYLNIRHLYILFYYYISLIPLPICMLIHLGLLAQCVVNMGIDLIFCQEESFLQIPLKR